MRKVVKICVLSAVIFALVLSPFGSAYAYNGEATTINETEITDDVIYELLVRSIINQYFLQREEFLLGNSDSISSAVPAIASDESSHMRILEGLNIIYLSSAITINSLTCWDYTADVMVTEIASYRIDNQLVDETVVHNLCVYMPTAEEIIVASDAYFEVLSNFCSCAYVRPSDNSVDIATLVPGSRYCIVEVAKGEEGVAETGDNVTKYGQWFGSYDEWCATFISWCAYQSNVSTSVIPRTDGVGAMRVFFQDRNAYYSSYSQGGNTRPNIGDIFFQYGSASSPGHVGIVVGIDGNTIYVVDGNCGKKVSYHTISLTSSDLVAFGKPAYAFGTHTAGTAWSKDSTHHWKHCIHCDATINKAVHSFVLEQIGGPYRCSACSYTTYNIPIVS